MIKTEAKRSTSIAKQDRLTPIDGQRALEHYYLCCLSRECSELGRKQVLTGKAKFGIIGDGKELPQVALATQFEKGDWRAGYYRDQTLMMALDLCTPSQFFRSFTQTLRTILSVEVGK